MNLNVVYCLDKPRKQWKNCNQVSKSQCSDLNPGTNKYKEDILIIWQWHLKCNFIFIWLSFFHSKTLKNLPLILQCLVSSLLSDFHHLKSSILSSSLLPPSVWLASETIIIIRAGNLSIFHNSYSKNTFPMNRIRPFVTFNQTSDFNGSCWSCRQQTASYVLKYLWCINTKITNKKNCRMLPPIKINKNFVLYMLKHSYGACLKAIEMLFSEIHNSYSE